MSKNSQRVLIVDDEPINLMMLANVLADQVDVVTAKSGDEALDILDHGAFSLLITDQRMPGMSGIDLLRKSRSLYPNMICFLMTAETDMDVFIEALTKSGAIRVINKPWKPDQVLEATVSALKMHEASMKNEAILDKLKEAGHVLDKVSNR